MKFVKMHGIGNDYVYLDAVGDPALAERDDLPALARAMSDRHTGIGSDGLILVCLPSDAATDAHVRMRMFNADGSESEMCGNGVRCVAKFAHDRLGIKHNPLNVETGAGVLPIATEIVDGELTSARVDMGEPVLKLDAVPVNVSELATVPSGDHASGGVTEGVIEAGGESYKVTFVSMGNPHAMIFVDDVAAIDLDRVGPLIETHRAFPSRMNVHFVEVHSLAEATMRTWERGSGITLACGTGASAVCVAGVRTGRFGRNVLLHLPGGDLSIRWDEATNHVFMTGPAANSFTGEWPGR